MFGKAFVGTILALVAVAVSGCITSTEHTRSESSGGAATERPLPDRKLRERMVPLIEDDLLFRTLIDGGAPRLLNAKVSRAFEHESLVQRRQAFYCVSAEIEQPLSGLIPTVRSVSFPILKLPDGTEHLGLMRSNVNGGPPECSFAKYEPFPELEQARIKRRLSLGKPA
jgi:hypothetical protein